MKPSKRILLVALLALAQPAQAFPCKIMPTNYLAVSTSGVVYAWMENRGIIGICNLATSSAYSTADACRAWFSALLTWRSMGKEAIAYFAPDNPTNSGATACSSLNGWEYHEAYHLEAWQ